MGTLLSFNDTTPNLTNLMINAGLALWEEVVSFTVKNIFKLIIPNKIRDTVSYFLF